MRSLQCFLAVLVAATGLIVSTGATAQPDSGTPAFRSAPKTPKFWRGGVPLAPRKAVLAATPATAPRPVAGVWHVFKQRPVKPRTARALRLGFEPNPTGALGASLVGSARTIAGTSSGIQSDEFNSASLSTGLWTYVDPVGDTTLTMTGTHATISLPAGTRHDLWTGVDEVPRMLQPAPNEDFEIEVKFDSAVSAGYQLQGLIVQQDAANLLRLEVHHDGGGAHLFVAAKTAGIASTVHYSDVPGGAPVYLRLVRSGNLWTFSYSSNGSSWASAPTFPHAMTVTAVGPFAGNSGGSPPAFTASIDYFREVTPAPPAQDTTPPAISGIAVTPSPVGAVVSWSTDEAATSAADFGPSASYGTTVSDPAFVTGHELSLSGLSCGTTYHYRVRSSDSSGNQASSGDGTFSTIACPPSMVSDEFDAASIDPNVWTFVDPLGDASVAANGTQAVITLPAGARHDLWTGADEVARLVQATPNGDFEVEVKFDSAPSAGYQMQGLIVQQDADDLLRLEVHHDGSGARVFIAGITNGTASTIHYANAPGGAPVYLNLKRSGNTWTFSRSSDGQSWAATTFTRAMTVTTVGPFIGNSGSSPPAFEGRIDYFRYVPPDLTPPQISGIAVTANPIAAEVAWTTDEPASARIDFGTTSAYGSTVARQSLTTDHRLAITGLSCATTYHYEIRSTDSSGNQAGSGDRTLATPACPASMTSDEFNAPALNAALWAHIDPIGDTSLSFNGSQAVISLPAGSRHDLWTGADEVPRLVQATPDQNFEVEVKFDSVPSARYQMEGLLVQQDAANLLRLEVHHDGGGLYLFLAGLTNGSASTIHYGSVPAGSAVYLKLKRKGSTWTIRYSSDGQSWSATTFTRAMAVSAVGPFAGNSGNSPPAFQAQIDYFRYFPPDLTPPQVSGVAATAGAIAAEIAWTTDEPATGAVSYGQTAAYEDGTLTAPGEHQAHQLTLHALQCETTYHFTVTSADAEGNQASSPDQTFTTAACPTELTGDEFDAGTLNSTLWTFYNPLGDATASPNGSQAVIGVPAGTAHDVWTGVDTVPRLLQAAPDANFEVEAKFDSPVTTRYQQQGIIVEQDANTLLRFEIHSEGTETKLFVASIGGSSASIKYNATVPGGAPAWLQVEREGDTWTARYSLDGQSWPTVARFDEVFTARAIGPYAGNAGTSPPAFSAQVDYFRVVPPPPPDLTPPVTTSIAALEHRVSATVTWSTDELATSAVDFGTTSSYGQTITSSGEVTAHRIRLTGLACNTTYHYRVRSTDEADNEAVSADQTLKTASCAPGPSIVVWDDQFTFGTIGIPQRWLNVLGNVEDPDGISSLSYRLNGGQSSTLSVGANADRLAYPGDFNIELYYGALLPGLNTVEITAVDTAGNTTVKSVEVDWQGNAGAPPPTDGPVLVVVAHPDDEGLGMAGVISQAQAAGRKVYVAIATNGDSNAPGPESGYCGAASGSEAAAAAYGLRRDGETMAAMGLLGLQWQPDLGATDIIFLGYPDTRLRDVASAGTPWDGDATGLHHTFAEDSDGSIATCNGDFRYLLDGQHSQLSAAALRADLDALLQVTNPSDVYTHAGFDGHTDHSEVYFSMVAAILRAGSNVRLHQTLIHPEGTEFCQSLSAAQWPNPALENDDPFARFTPTLDVTAPPTPTCSPNPTGSSWGPEGAPNEIVEVPAAMQATTEAANLKWQVISRYETQLGTCTPNPDYHVNCGYLRAFVKKHEFFWTRVYGAPKTWPNPYAAQFASASSASELAQVMDGQWTHDGNGIRPVSTGFDRLVTLGDMAWKNYEVSAEITFNSFDQSNPIVGAAAGLAVGWQGHTAWGQPRFGHPSAGICIYAWDNSDPLFFKVQLGYSPGEAHDTVLDKSFTDLALGVPHRFRFRHNDLGNGTTRYSCKVWPSDEPEPAGWTVEADIPYWQGETGTHPGSVVLVAHNADTTFNDVSVTPVGG